MSVLTLAALAAVFFAPLLLMRYVAHLPYAPACPRCRSMTAQMGSVTSLDRAVAAATGALARQCTRCGWMGRMRWRVSVLRGRDPDGP